ncbi:alpha and gamma adaptin binding protein p34-domain-containing protein [Verticillium dahliae]|uniref:Alpha and gamma adaptin binding protein p34 n=1 Tax=Verticillium dahliae TaxID=27337 RepID=A0A2J8BZ48_VERDA|nr:alpha and gamma adaptin binding protein p34-domain-containing protein [Verticillium dahliae]PNH30047.1 hypothetical protein BJF96_g6741 [Verticillium dahliae]PNH50960.1 hypothetical protein VD0003_g6246 [Verticillium dahliae]RXG44504.1 hypothetical protein VDGE_30219 [Verticillium dahliae]
MEITNPKRILALAAHDRQDDLARFLGALTGTTPEPSAAASATPSLAGTSHVLPLTTSYYTATVPVWLDLVADADGAEDEDWAASFLAPEAREVLDALGGIVVVLPVTRGVAAARGLVEQVGRVVREGLGGWGWDGVGLAVGVGAGGGEAEGEAEQGEWEDLCGAAGLEFVRVRGVEEDKGKNEFGEKMGVHRVLEALEANDWDQGDIPSDLEDDFGSLEDGRDDPESLDFGVDRADFEGLRQAIWGLDTEPRADGDVDSNGDGEARGSGAQDEPLDEATEVEKLESMMRKLQAVRDMSAGLPEEQRKKMAAKAVNEVMKDL